MEIQLADVDNTKVEGKEIPLSPIHLAKDRKKLNDFWESFGGSI
jgi:hypothetical protein